MNNNITLENIDSHPVFYKIVSCIALFVGTYLILYSIFQQIESDIGLTIMSDDPTFRLFITGVIITFSGFVIAMFNLILIEVKKK